MLSQSVAQILEKRFEEKQEQNPLYSLRAFARDLGVSSGQLSMILSKKRGVSTVAADKLADALKLNRFEKKFFLQLAAHEYGRSKKLQGIAHKKLEQIKQIDEGTKLSQDEFTLISDWYPMAILQVMQLKSYVTGVKSEGECRFISKRLNLTEPLIEDALKRLLKLGAIENHDGFHLPSSSFLMINARYPKSALKKFHQQNIAKALEALEFQDTKDCAFKTTMISIDGEDFTKMNEEISEFCKSLMIKYGKTLSSGKANQVYALTQQFFKIAEVKNA